MEVGQRVSPYEPRHQAMQLLTQRLGTALIDSGLTGHALEIGYAFQQQFLPRIMQQFEQQELPKLLNQSTICHTWQHYFA